MQNVKVNIPLKCTDAAIYGDQVSWGLCGIEQLLYISRWTELTPANDQGKHYQALPNIAARNLLARILSLLGHQKVNSPPFIEPLRTE